jgi:hypothetical protein
VEMLWSQFNNFATMAWEMVIYNESFDQSENEG